MIAVKACLPVIFNHYLNDSIFSDKSKLLTKLKEMFENWKVLFHKLINNEEDKIELLNFLEEFCINNDNFKLLFNLIIQMICLYQIVSQKIVCDWIKTKNDDNELAQQVNFYKELVC